MSESTRVTSRRRGTSPAAQASLPDDDDMLREILLRIPPQPSSLPRASAVCKRWLGLVTDPKFIRRFHAHHRKPPLLGLFQCSYLGIEFTPVLDPPDRIPPVRFSLGRCISRDYELLDCRHGLVLVKDREGNEVVVCNPITGGQRRVALPSEFKRGYFTGAVLCAAGNQGHVHGGCHSIPFKVVLKATYTEDNEAVACVYSSETGEWGNLISAEAPFEIIDLGSPATLVGNVLYWLFRGYHILEFDLDRQNLAVTMGPPVTNEFQNSPRHIIQAEDGDVGFAILAHPGFQMWQRNVSCQGVATWVPWKTIGMHTILGLPSPIEGVFGRLLGYDDDNDVIFVHASRNVYAVQLKSMESKKLYKTNCISRLHPFMSFYTPGADIASGVNGAEMLHYLV